MSNNRFKLPESLTKSKTTEISQSGKTSSDALDLAKERTLQEQLKRDTAFSGNRAQVLTEGIGLLRDLVGVLQSAVDVKKTATEWNGRVRKAEEEVKLAQKRLEQIQAENEPLHRQLDNIDLILGPVMSAFNKLESIMDPSLIDNDHQREVRASMEFYMARVVELVLAGKR